MFDMQYGGMNVYGLTRSQLVSSVFISRFTLTASECEAVTADDGYKVHSPLSMK